MVNKSNIDNSGLDFERIKKTVEKEQNNSKETIDSEIFTANSSEYITVTSNHGYPQNVPGGNKK